MEQIYQALELSVKANTEQGVFKYNILDNILVSHATFIKEIKTCQVCKQKPHQLYQCEKFYKMRTNDRVEGVKKQMFDLIIV